MTSDLFVRANPLTAASLTPAERLAEIAEILAAGLMRIRARKSSQISPDGGESSLDREFKSDADRAGNFFWLQPAGQ